ncbi:GNAT family N-acetyltransferase [Bacillus pumilus]|uniref:GNAT family N-acetyltransferase n=1 Tax=Bacillus pumilus TaxID=1408 RepID=UPI0011E959CB|nr:GNAT family protein [Bacillus pumilus]TYS28172.1 GNAT family N-acetyltransferase [Bacillus pumilus]TYS40799.1 GNAT family N-acetyltransferase [Bacillus pumilus]
MKKKGQYINVRTLTENDAQSLLTLELENRTYFQQFTPLVKDDFFTLSRQIERIQRSEQRSAQDEAYMHGIFLNETDTLIGTISLSSVERGPIEGALLGYVLDEKHGGKGYMTEAIRLIIEYAFDELHLHRIEAGVKPDNIGSIRVLEKTGFENEGLNRKKVKVNGEWEDHYLFAIIHPDES